MTVLSEEYKEAIETNAHPERWSGKTRNWKWIDQVHLNPDRDMLIQIDEERLAA